MQNKNNESGNREGHILSLQAYTQPASSSQNKLESESSISMAGERNDTLMLCSEEMPSTQELASESTLTYATLDADGNIVLQPFKSNGQYQHTRIDTQNRSDIQKQGVQLQEVEISQGPAQPQLVVVGNATTGDGMTYIYIQGDPGTETSDIEGISTTDSHTITLNSEDGSTLQTLPATYSHHLENAYGDLVLVDAETTQNDRNVNAKNGSLSNDDQVLLFSVAPNFELENQVVNNTLTVPSPKKVFPHERQQLMTSKMHLEKTLDNNQIMNDDNEAEKVDDPSLPVDDETTTIEARIATRDSLLPPRRQTRRSVNGFGCPVCNIQLKSKKQLRIHLQQHHGDKVWLCDVCDFSCETSWELRQHKNENHKEDRPFSCHHCSMSFPKLLMLDDHVRSVHDKERPYSCSFCMKGFYRPHDLKMHLNLHLGIKSNVCYVCGRQFSHPSNLIRHHRLHSGIKPYVCSTCGRRFTQATALQKHQISHQSKAGVCPLCPATFRSLSGLIKHSKIEHKKILTMSEAARIIRGKKTGGTRSYYCFVCGEQFTIKSDLKLHEKQKHGNETELKCKNCHKVYKSVYDVKVHACISPEEERSGREKDKMIIESSKLSPRNSKDEMFNLKDDHEVDEPPDEEGEEYLVMYITPEGESVSYVMKKGGKGAADKVLEVNAHQRREQLGQDEAFNLHALPEETIMINVHDKHTGPNLTQESQDSISHSTSIPDQDKITRISNQNSSFNQQCNIFKITNGNKLFSNKKNYENKISKNKMVVSGQQSNIGITLELDKQSNYMDNDMDNDSIMHEEDSIILSQDETFDLVKREEESLIELTDFSEPVNGADIKLKHEIYSKVEMDRLLNDKGYSTNNENILSKVIKKKVKDKNSKVKELKPIVIKEENAIDNYGKKPVAVKSLSKSKSIPLELKCDVCFKTFKKRWNHQQHIAMHNSELHKYQCQICSKTFAYRSTLNKHLEKHKPPTIHQCPLCEKSYKNVASLKQHHRRDHLRHRPYACSLCTKTFFSKSDFDYHMRLHKKEHPYMCFACGREFTHTSHLHRHERIHTRERPHKCHYCAKTFIQYVTLKVHLKKHERQMRRDIEDHDKLSNIPVTTDSNQATLASQINLAAMGSEMDLDVSGMTDSLSAGISMVNDAASSVGLSGVGSGSINGLSGMGGGSINMAAGVSLTGLGNGPNMETLGGLGSAVGEAGESVVTTEGLDVDSFPAGTVILTQSSIIVINSNQLESL